MPSARYFIAPDRSDISGRLVIECDEAHHMKGVSRVRKGDSVFLLDGKGYVHSCDVIETDARRLVMEVTSSELFPEPPPVDMAISVIKAPRMEMSVEKCTELGVRRMIPLVSKRSVWRGGKGRSPRFAPGAPGGFSGFQAARGCDCGERSPPTGMHTEPGTPRGERLS